MMGRRSAGSRSIPGKPCAVSEGWDGPAMRSVTELLTCEWGPKTWPSMPSLKPPGCGEVFRPA